LPSLLRAIHWAGMDDPTRTTGGLRRANGFPRRDWEYRQETVPLPDFGKTAGALGGDGWEMVAAHYDGGAPASWRCIFKRPAAFH
jgi:hypothetical protein